MAEHRLSEARSWEAEVARSGLEPGVKFCCLLLALRFSRMGSVGLAEARKDEWLPTEADRAFIKNLMSRPVYDAGKFANWIAPAAKGINRLPVEFEYVRTEG